MTTMTRNLPPDLITLPRSLLLRLCAHADQARRAARAVIIDCEQGIDGDSAHYQAWLAARDDLNATMGEVALYLMTSASHGEWAPHLLRQLADGRALPGPSPAALPALAA